MDRILLKSIKIIQECDLLDCDSLSKELQFAIKKETIFVFLNFFLFLTGFKKIWILTSVVNSVISVFRNHILYINQLLRVTMCLEKWNITSFLIWLIALMLSPENFSFIRQRLRKSWLLTNLVENLCNLELRVLMSCILVSEKFSFSINW